MKWSRGWGVGASVLNSRLNVGSHPAPRTGKWVDKDSVKTAHEALSTPPVPRQWQELRGGQEGGEGKQAAGGVGGSLWVGQALGWMHLFQFLGPGFLRLPKAVLSLLGLLEAAHHLFVEGVLLPVLDLLKVLVHQRGLHLQVQLTHLLRLGHDGHPGLLHRPVLGPWYRREAGGSLGTVGPRQAPGGDFLCEPPSALRMGF